MNLYGKDMNLREPGPSQIVQGKSMLQRRTAVLLPFALATTSVVRPPMAFSQSQAKVSNVPPFTPTDLMMHSTVRIECVGPNGEVSTGTGFFYSLFAPSDQPTPVIVTNKHVLSGKVSAKLVLTLANPDGSPDIGNLERVETADLSAQWIGHPDPKVDLAILSTVTISRALDKSAKRPFLVFLDQSIIPTIDAYKLLTPVEGVLVVGYPDGIWDAKNNAPIFR